MHHHSYYTPTPGGTNTIYHYLAGDLHTPNPGIGIMTPTSLGASEGALSHTLASNAYAHPQSFNPQDFHHRPYDPTGLYQMGQFSGHGLHLAPYDTLIGRPSERHMSGDVSLTEVSPVVPLSAQFDAPYPVVPQKPAEDFRFRATLNAPTAMVQHADEIPITYLNKGQAYTFSIHDTTPDLSSPVKYRTFIRVSFEDEQQRQCPAACWQLWKEGRGTSEAHQRGGRLLAVEHVESNLLGADPSAPQVQLVYTSFDGFAIEWSPSGPGQTDCTISVRFNFLSTDFSHSKGVKGIPVRLCAKSQVIVGQVPEFSENVYCKVKLFRDHGAERKLANDVAHVKKSIDKLKHQIVQVEAGVKDSGRRKRKSILLGEDLNRRPAKVAKTNRSWSISDTSDASAPKASIEDDLQFKLLAVQDMFSSTRTMSVLSLRGEEGDDPDQCPVTLPPSDKAEMARPPLIREPTGHSSGDRRSSLPDTFASSRASSSMLSSLAPATPISQADSTGNLLVSSPSWQVPMGPPKGPREFGSISSDGPMSVPRLSSGANSGDYLKVLDVDRTYVPPLERQNKPVACFYVLAASSPETESSEQLYKAVYLRARSLTEFINAIAKKIHGELVPVTRVIRHTTKGIDVVVDDEMITEIGEGQDMRAEICIVQRHFPVKVEASGERDGHGQAVDAVTTAEGHTLEGGPTEYEMKVYF